MFEIDQVCLAAQNTLPLIYLWYGEDRYLIQEALREIKRPYLAEDPSGSNIEVISAREAPPSVIVERVNTYSFFSGRLVIVEDPPYFQSGDTAELQVLLDYFRDPNPGACLLFCAESVNKGSKFYKALQKSGVVLEFLSPRRNQEWLIWLKRELEQRALSMEPGAAELFLTQTGHQTGMIAQELDKLAVYCTPSAKISAADIQEVVIANVEVSIFDLLDAVGQRSVAQAIGKLEEILRTENALKVLATLTGHVRLLLGAVVWRQKGGKGAELAAALGVNPYRAQKIWQQSAGWSYVQLVKGMALCLETEQGAKSGVGAVEILLAMMVVRFCEP
ncbi:MAG: DNA polymerase III subunit delta [Peptococcaceae bacterium]|nr:DNA polymerase III subunit delta [Peptococcaceae bacterium]